MPEDQLYRRTAFGDSALDVLKMENKMSYNEKYYDPIFTQKEVVDYERTFQDMGPKDRRIVRLLSDYGIEGKRCLDVGPGIGRWLYFVKKHRAAYVAGIDVSSVAIDRCGKFCDKLQKCDVENDPFDFDSDYFDVILSFELLEHLKDPGNYFREMLRVVKHHGMIIMTTPNIISLISRIRVIFGMLPIPMTNDKTHIRFYRKKDIRHILSEFNMTPIFLPTAISLNPLRIKSRLSIPSFTGISMLEDNLLFYFKVDKARAFSTGKPGQ